MTADPAISAVIERAYEALAFPPGQEPDWQLFNGAFHPAAILGLRVFPHDKTVSVLGLKEYAKAQMGNDLSTEGYSETPGERSCEVLGDIATVRQDFTMNFASSDPVQAIDCFSLVRASGEWLIISVVSDMAPAG